MHTGLLAQAARTAQHHYHHHHQTASENLNTAPHGPARTVWSTRFGAMAHRRGEFADPWTDQGSLFRIGGREGKDWTGC